MFLCYHIIYNYYASGGLLVPSDGLLLIHNVIPMLREVWKRKTFQ